MLTYRFTAADRVKSAVEQGRRTQHEGRSCEKIDQTRSSADMRRLNFAGFFILRKRGETRKATVPRMSFTYEREPQANFWLVEMPEQIAGIYGIEDMALSESEDAGHRTRIAAGA